MCLKNYLHMIWKCTFRLFLTYSYIVWNHFSHSSLQIEKEQELHLKLHLRHVDTRLLLLILPAYHKGNKNVGIIQGVSKRICQFQTSLIFMIKTHTVRKWGFVSLIWLSVGSITTGCSDSRHTWKIWDDLNYCRDLHQASGDTLNTCEQICM